VLTPGCPSRVPGLRVRRGVTKTAVDKPTFRGAYSGFVQRQPCLNKGCFATFDGSPARTGEVRYCNRTGPDGGHVHRWDGQRWQVAGDLEHDRR
jgi:hypothetical protein